MKLNYLLTAGNYTYAIITGIAVIIFIVGLFVLRFIYKIKKQARYYVKDSLLTATEIAYYRAIDQLIGNNYIILPQINLASVIDKEGGNFSRTELFRNIDFGVFDYSYRPLLLIEINDRSHFRQDRIERDQKVSTICKKAGIPLVTFWTKDGINMAQMQKQLAQYLYME